MRPAPRPASTPPLPDVRSARESDSAPRAEAGPECGAQANSRHALRWWRVLLPFRTQSETATARAKAAPDPLLEFRSEGQRTRQPQKGRARAPWGRFAVAALALVSLGQGAFIATRLLTTGQRALSTGGLSLESTPTGVEVIVDGQRRGLTPLRMALTTGSHVMELRYAGQSKTIPLSISPGVDLARFVEMPSPEGPSVGQLHIVSEPAGARVSVDGEPTGVTPLTLHNPAPGEHRVVLRNDAGSVERTVRVEKGATASLVVSLAGPSVPSSALSGWIAVSSPVDLQIYEGNRLLGTTDVERIMVPVGRHQIDLVNETLGYRTTEVVQVQAGRTGVLRIALPHGTNHLNAVPWAEVWVDGARLGETPIGNLPLSIGPHEVLFLTPNSVNVGRRWW